MGTRQIKSSLTRGIFFFFIFLLTSSKAEVIDSTTNSNGIITADSSGPSLSNLSKNLNLGAEELEKIRHEEILSYVYMGVGFLIVIFIAWFTTVLAKKQKNKELEIRASRLKNTHPKQQHSRRR
jgi:hypothetical protein